MAFFNGLNGVFGGLAAGVPGLVNPAAPQLLTPPAISGTAGVGQSLTVDPGTWSNAPTGYLHQWLANGRALSGANATSFSPTSAEAGAAIEVIVTAQNGKGATSALAFAGVVPPAGAGPALLPLQSRLVGLGDSIVAGSSGASIFTIASALAGGRYFVPPGGNQGIGGSTTADLLSRTASQDGSLAKALTLNPKVVHLHCGTNDLAALGATAADLTGRLRQILDQIKAAGAAVVVDTILPRSDATWTSAAGIGRAERESRRLAVNSWITGLSEPGVWPVDLDGVGFDPASSDALDGLHPSRPGAWKKCSPAIAARLAGLVEGASILYAAPSDMGNLITEASMEGTGGTLSGAGVSGQAATGWAIGTSVSAAGLTIVGSKETGPDGYARQVLTFSGTAPSNGSVLVSRSQPYTGVAGEAYDLWCHAEWSDLTGVRAFFMKAGGTVDFEGNTSAVEPPPRYAGPIRNIAGTLAANASSGAVQFGFYFGSGVAISGTLKISRPTWRKVPAGQ